MIAALIMAVTSETSTSEEAGAKTAAG
jgi:hypothetical protein